MTQWPTVVLFSAAVSWMVIRKVLGVWILLFWGAMACAQNKDHILERAFFEDTSGRLTLEQFAQANLKPFSGVLSQGYTHATLWVRLHLEGDTSANSLILRIRPNFLDEVVLYDPVFGSLGENVRGDEQGAQDAYRSLNLNFTLPAGKSPRDIWLRIRTNSTLLFTVQALDFEEAVKQDLAQELKSGFYVGLVILFIVWGVLHWWATRDRIIGTFVLKEILCLVYLIGFLGYLRNFWPAGWDIATGPFVDLSFGPYVAASYYFDYRFLRDYRPNRYLLTALKWMPAFLPVYLLLMAMDQSQWAFIFNMSLIVIAPFLSLGLAFTARPPGPEEASLATPCLSRRALVTLYIAILAGLSISTLPAMGIIQGGDFVFDGFLVYSLLSGLGVLIVLEIRIRNGERRRIALEFEHQDAQQRFEDERKRREQQAQFLAMLTHELRTPLSVVRMAIGVVGQKYGIFTEAEQSIEEMAAILERCLTTDQIEGGQIKPDFCDCSARDELMCLIERCPDPSRIHFQGKGDAIFKTDVVLFRLVVANLIDNALKYGEKSSIISVTLDVQQAVLNILVENLPGKAHWPDPQKLFQKYYRSPKAQKISGTGLGLYLSYQISESLGGSLTYTPSATHVGFTLCLPL